MGKLKVKGGFWKKFLRFFGLVPAKEYENNIMLTVIAIGAAQAIIKDLEDRNESLKDLMKAREYRAEQRAKKEAENKEQATKTDEKKNAKRKYTKKTKVA